MFISTKRHFFINKLWFLLLDTLALLTALSLATYFRFGLNEAQTYMHYKKIPFIICILLSLVFFYINGLYDFKVFKKYSDIFKKIFLSVFIGLVINSIVFYATFSLAIGRGVFVITALIAFIIISIPRTIQLFFSKQRYLYKKTLIVGTGNAAKETVELIRKHTLTAAYDIVGIIDEESYSGDLKTGESIHEVSILGDIHSIAEVVRKNKVDIVIVTTLEPKRLSILKNLRICRYLGIEIYDVVTLSEELENRVPLNYIDDEWLLSSILSKSNFHVKKVKRLFDIVGSVFAMILLLPICILAMLCIKFDSKGPVFYYQKRAGKNRKRFNMIKFRTMVHKAEKKTGPVLATKDDARITRVGKILRKTRIDEIPQLMNVFLGHMSLVGPRPERPAFIKILSKEIPFYPERLYVQPGLTGWAQVNYPYAETIEEQKRKLEYDIYYIKNVSFFLDCYILIKTIIVTFFAKGR